jgi:lipopolysaccharide biosynthesis regulator YciM
MRDSAQLPKTDQETRSSVRSDSGTRSRHKLLLSALCLTALAILIALYALRSRRSPGPDRLWQSGQAALRAGRIDEAEAAALSLSRLRVPTPWDRTLRAQVDVARNRPDDALSELGRVPDEHPAAAQARLLAGQIELRRNRMRIAERYLREAVRLDPKLVMAHRELIYIYGYQLRRRELDAEFRALASLTELTFDNVFHWCLLKNSKWEPGQAAETLASFTEADPEDRWSRLALAENYRLMGLTDDAEKAISTLPEIDTQARAIRVMLALDRHQEERAQAMLAAGDELDPALARLRGKLALARHDGPAAARFFRIAMAEDPENRDALFGLINALSLTGDDAAATPLRETAKRLELLNTLIQQAASSEGRNNPRLLQELGDACAALGHNAEARAWYKVAIARNPLDTEAQQALFRLASQESSRAGDESGHLREPTRQ